MKQSIRIETFETNSSSYHTLSIRKVSEKPIKREIVVGQDLVINNHINYKTIGWTESYSFIGTSSYEKAQLILRFIGYYLDDAFDDIEELKPLYEDEKGNWNIDKRRQAFKDHFYEFPLIQAYVKAVKRFIGEDKNVIIEFNEHSSPYIESVDDENKSTYEIFGVAEEDLSDVNKMTDVFYNIIFNPDVEMIEECESNE